MCHGTGYLGCIVLRTPKPLYETLYTCPRCGEVQILTSTHPEVADGYQRVIEEGRIELRCKPCLERG